MVSSDPRRAMSRDRFQGLAEAYGSDLRRWPGEVRAAAARFADEQPQAAGRILAQEALLDEALDAASPPAPGWDLEMRVMAGARARGVGRRHAARQVGAQWRPAGGLAAAAAAGILAGYLGMAAAAAAGDPDDVADPAWVTADGDASPWTVE